MEVRSTKALAISCHSLEVLMRKLTGGGDLGDASVASGVDFVVRPAGFSASDTFGCAADFAAGDREVAALGGFEALFGVWRLS